MTFPLTDPRARVVYIGLSGRVWHLAGLRMGEEGVMLGTGPSGLLFPDMDLLWTEGARQEGATYRDTVIPKREIDLVAQVGFEGDKHLYHRVFDAWMRDWSSRQRGHLGVWTTYAGWRWLRVRLGGAPQPQFGKDPALSGTCDFDMTVIADDPLWSSFERDGLWKNTSGVGVGSLRIPNPADEVAWPRFYMPGPGVYEIQDGENGPMIPVPALQAGETLKIDTHPRRPTARVYSAATGENGRNVWALLKGQRWRRPLQPWSSTVINCTVTGGNAESQVFCLAGPRFERPW
ncbi:phage tail protein [Rhodococcus hoagii]|nr:phage tail protein [Prescottella equi]